MNLTSVDTCLSTLKAADEYLCHPLCIQCGYYLSQNLTKDNVLEIFRSTFRFCSICCEENYIPSAPSETQIAESTATDNTTNDMKETFDDLVEKCLTIIDKSGNDLVKSETFEDLDRECLRVVVFRDTLKVSEIELFRALVRWAECTCKRSGQTINSEQIRSALGELRFAPRYLTLSSQEFLDVDGPGSKEVLTRAENNAIVAHIFGNPAIEFPSGMEEYVPILKTPRNSKNYNKCDSNKEKKKKKKWYSNIPENTIVALSYIFD